MPNAVYCGVISKTNWPYYSEYSRLFSRLQLRAYCRFRCCGHIKEPNPVWISIKEALRKLQGMGIIVREGWSRQLDLNSWKRSQSRRSDTYSESKQKTDELFVFCKWIRVYLKSFKFELIHQAMSARLLVLMLYEDKQSKVISQMNQCFMV